ncbi:MAG: efflux RND transporter periplasmic adaptor subunit [Candidatus Omnitrophica bacterium]|nr:efflux RND transporter periplasmic adaptor subunit [Candidatus Omnitrophota bacterium]
MKKILIIVIVAFLIAAGFIFFKNYDHKDHTNMKLSTKTDGKQEILYYTCGMHPSVRVSPKDYKAGNTKCPICAMDLVPVYAQEDEQGVEGKNDLAGEVVKISSQQIKRVGIETYQVKTINLFKEIRTVGVVAYDPSLRTTQQEYLQALESYQKIVQSGFPDAKKRAKEMVEATKIKLELLGFGKSLIEELTKKAKADKSLILPDNQMWVYADIYEYESSWPIVGDKVIIMAEARPDLKFAGEIKAIEPVVEEKTRTLKLKILVENQQNILKPNMYVDVTINIDLGPVQAVPKTAVLDTGKRKIIYVALGKNSFVAREVVVGPVAKGIVNQVKTDFYPLIEGAKLKDYVVSKGNFLIDSQAELGAASVAYGGALGEEEKPPAHQH